MQLGEYIVVLITYYLLMKFNISSDLESIESANYPIKSSLLIHAKISLDLNRILWMSCKVSLEPLPQQAIV